MKSLNSGQRPNVGDVDEVIAELLEKVPAEQVRSLIAFAKFIDSPARNNAPRVRVLPSNVREIHNSTQLRSPAH